MHVLSDFSFAERAVINVWIWLWFIHRVWSTDRFASLRLNKLRNFDLKSIITLLIIIMLPVQAIFDVTWTYIKYSEGFIQDPSGSTGSFVSKPPYYMDGNVKKPLWSEEHLTLKTITEYILACSFAFQIGTLALVQAFWNYLASQIERKPFIRSWKSRLYIVWFFASMIIFPVARGLVSNDIILVETVPELIFAIQLLVVVLLGIQNGRSLNKLLKTIQYQRTPTGQVTILRIHYYIEMNGLLLFGALLLSIGFLTITLDSISKLNNISQSKFWMDLFIIHANFGSFVLWISMIMIIYPRYYITGLSGILGPRSELNGSVSIQSLGTEPSKSKNSFIINLTSNNETSKPSTNEKIVKSVTSLLEHQQQQIEIYRHKTSMSISSTATLTSSNAPASPLILPSPAVFKNSI